MQKIKLSFIDSDLLYTGTFKKSLKIPKRQSKTIYRRMTDNTMAKRKRTKGQTTFERAQHRFNDIKDIEMTKMPR